MAGWHHRCNGHELGQTPGNGEGQGGLVCYSPWGRKELDTTGRLNNNDESIHTVGQLPPHPSPELLSPGRTGALAPLSRSCPSLSPQPPSTTAELLSLCVRLPRCLMES